MQFTVEDDTPASKIAKRYLSRYGPDARRSQCLHYSNLNVCYNFFPKTACTSLKYSFGLADGTLLPEDDPHTCGHFVMSNDTEVCDCTKVAVFRNPYTRAVSAYLDKLAHPNPKEPFAIDLTYQAISDIRGIASHAVPNELTLGKTLSFEEFIKFIAQSSDEFLDYHWRSQLSMLAYPEYDAFFSFDDLATQWQHSSFSYIELHRNAPHQTPLSDYPSADQMPTSRLLPSKMYGQPLLRDIVNGTAHFSKLDFFNDPDIHQLFYDRFYDDITFYKYVFPAVYTFSTRERNSF